VLMTVRLQAADTQVCVPHCLSLPILLVLLFLQPQTILTHIQVLQQVTERTLTLCLSLARQRLQAPAALMPTCNRTSLLRCGSVQRKGK